MLVNDDHYVFRSPTPPTTRPTDLVDALEKCSLKDLDHVADYAEVLTEHREREARLEDEMDEGNRTRRDETTRRDWTSEDLSDDVPPKATITLEEINENRHYW